MTRFERDMNEIKNDCTMATIILMERRAEIEKIQKEMRTTKNQFIAVCKMQEITRLSAEYAKLDQMI